MGSVAVITEHLEGSVHVNAIMSGIIIPSRCGNTRPRMLAIKRHHCCGNERKQATTAILSQHRSTEDNLKILLRILSIIYFMITSLNHIHDYAFYAWTQVDTIRVCTSIDSQTFRQSSLQFGWAPFNPHLPSGFTFLRPREYRQSGIEISQYRRITIRGVFWGVVVWQRGEIYIYRGDELWYRFREVVLATQVQEVES